MVIDQFFQDPRPNLPHVKGKLNGGIELENMQQSYHGFSMQDIQEQNCVKMNWRETHGEEEADQRRYRNKCRRNFNFGWVTRVF